MSSILLMTLPLTSIQTLECGMRALAYRRAVQMQPWRGGQHSTWEALQLGSLCGHTPPSPDPALMTGVASHAPVAADSIWVCPMEGNDVASGDRHSPLLSLHAAVRLARERPSTNQSIVLKGGIYYMGGANGTLQLGHSDAGLVITSAPGETAWLSGGKLLSGLSWVRATHPSKGNVWVADLSGFGDLGDVRGLFTTGGDRFVRARYPNANP
jgi:hypothetical protein